MNKRNEMVNELKLVGNIAIIKTFDDGNSMVTIAVKNSDKETEFFKVLVPSFVKAKKYKKDSEEYEEVEMNVGDYISALGRLANYRTSEGDINLGVKIFSIISIFQKNKGENNEQ